MLISRKFGGAKSVVFGGLNSRLGGLAPLSSPLPFRVSKRLKSISKPEPVADAGVTESMATCRLHRPSHDQHADWTHKPLVRHWAELMVITLTTTAPATCCGKW